MTHHNKIATVERNDARKKLSFCVNAPSSEGDSHLILTNHPRGKRRRTNSVPFLSFPKDQTFGHIHTENS